MRKNVRIIDVCLVPDSDDEVKPHLLACRPVHKRKPKCSALGHKRYPTFLWHLRDDARIQVKMRVDEAKRVRTDHPHLVVPRNITDPALKFNVPDLAEAC